jgi:hypothetical protein
MSEKNILLKMSLEKNRMVKEMIEKFLGHEPSSEERKAFKIMQSLGESTIYYQGVVIGTVQHLQDDEPFI